MRKRKEGGPSSSHHINKGAALYEARTAEQAKKKNYRARVRLALLQENGLANAPQLENLRKALIDMRKMRSSTQPSKGARKPALLNKHLS